MFPSLSHLISTSLKIKLFLEPVIVTVTVIPYCPAWVKIPYIHVGLYSIYYILYSLLVYISRRISLVRCLWKYIVQGAAVDNIVNISQGRGLRDIFFHEHCSQWDPPWYIVFIPQSVVKSYQKSGQIVKSR